MAIVDSLPEAEATCAGERHLALSVRGKKFGYYLDDHHGDGIIAVAFKTAHGEQEALVGSDSDRFYVPAYLGAKGWVAIRLDLAEVEWAEVRRTSHRRLPAASAAPSRSTARPVLRQLKYPVLAGSTRFVMPAR